MKEIVAYCGIVCSECPAYKATRANDNAARAKIAAEWSKQYNKPMSPDQINCDGCISVGGKHLGYCAVCEIRKCGTGRNVENCAYCEMYPCEKVIEFQSRAPETKAKLEAIRKKK